MTAPRPRPPQPMRPTRISSLPAAQAPGSTGAASVPPTTAAPVFRKSRRVVAASFCLSLMVFSVGSVVGAHVWSVASGALPRDLRAQPHQSFGSSATARTTRKPTWVASVSHQMLCGRWGSRRFQAGSEAAPRGAAQPRGVVVPGAAAHHVRVACPSGRTTGDSTAAPPARPAGVGRPARSGRAPTPPRCRACRTGPRRSASCAPTGWGWSSALSRDQACSASAAGVAAEGVARVVVPARQAYSHSASVGRR